MVHGFGMYPTRYLSYAPDLCISAMCQNSESPQKPPVVCAILVVTAIATKFQEMRQRSEDELKLL